MVNKLDIVMSIIDAIFAPDTYKFNKISAHLKRFFPNDSKTMNELLDGFNINTRNEDGKNLLHLFADREKFCKIVLERGIDVNARDKLGNTPIFYTKVPSICSLFIAHGAYLNLRNNARHSVLHKQSRNYVASLVEPLIRAGATIDYNEYDQYELLQIATLFRDKDKMKELIAEQPASLHTICRGEWYPSNEILFSPIFVAANNGFYDEFQLLVEAIGDKIDSMEIMRIITYIIVSSWDIKKKRGKVDIAKSIVKLFPQILIDGDKNKDSGSHILHKCYLNAELLEMFLELGLDIHCKTDIVRGEGMTRNRMRRQILSDAEPLLYFTDCTADITFYKLLFARGADPNLQNCFGVTAFMGICHSEHLMRKDIPIIKELVQLFLDNGANVYMRDNDGNNAIDYIMNNHWSTSEEKAAIVRTIYEKEKFVILEPRTNEFVYNLLRNVRHE